jgi:hypothetical protein
MNAAAGDPVPEGRSPTATDGGPIHGHRRSLPGSWRLAAYVFLPFLVFFFVPLIVYRIPLRIPLDDNAREVYAGGRYVLEAVAVCLAWLGIACGILVWPSRTAAGPRFWAPRALWGAFVSMSIVGSIVAVIHLLFAMPAPLEEFVHVVALAPTLGFILGLYVWRDLIGPPAAAGGGTVSGTSLRKIVVVVLLVIDLGAALAVPFLLSVMMPAALSMLAILYGAAAMGLSVRRRLLLCLLLIPLLLVAFPLKAVVRNTVWHGPFIRGYLGAKIVTPMHANLHRAIRLGGRFVEAVPKGYDPWSFGLRFHQLRGLPPFWTYAVQRAFNRINRLSDLTYVVEETPVPVPYNGGSTYAPLVWKAIPRVLWETRPPEDAGQVYGHRYDLISPHDLVGSYNLPMVTEGWMSDGWVGVVLSAAVVGIILRLAWRYWIGDSAAPGNVVLGMVIVATAADAESNLSIVMGGVIHAFVFYWIVEVLVRAWGRRAAARVGGRPRLTASPYRSAG